MLKLKFLTIFILITLFVSSIQLLAKAEPMPLNEISEAVYNKATCNGKYQGLIYILKVPEDKAQYGAFSDYGFWEGGEWGGIKFNPGGYWVYVEQYWLVFKTKN